MSSSHSSSARCWWRSRGCGSADRRLPPCPRLPAPPSLPGGDGAPPRGGVQAFDEPLPDALSPRNASYDIDVRLDTVRKELKGRETIRWRNISAATTSELQFHLYWNGWRNRDSTWEREDRLATPPARLQEPERRPEDTGASDVTRLRVTPAGGDAVDLTPAIRYLAPDDGNAADRTVMAVTLPEPIGPGGSVQIEIEWTGRIPFAAARTGWIADYYFFGQWFPKIGVLEDTGWNTHQFHRATEFYADFGVYDVQMTVPAGYKVGASGREMRRVDNADGTTTHTYHADDVADFGWTTSPSFIEERRAFNHARCRAWRCGCCCGPSTAARRRGISRPRPPRSSTSASGSGPIPTATSPSSIPRIRAPATAWSTRCCSPAAPTGWRRRRWPCPSP